MGRRPPKNLIISPSPLSSNYFRKLNKSIFDFLLKFCYNIYVRGKQSSPFSPVPSYTWGAPSAKGWRSFLFILKLYTVSTRAFNIIFIFIITFIIIFIFIFIYIYKYIFIYIYIYIYINYILYIYYPIISYHKITQKSKKKIFF